MAQRKAARIAGRTGITSSAQTALGALPVYKRNYVLARAQGKSVAESSVNAGVATSTGRNYEKESLIQQAYRELMVKAIPPEKLVRLIKGGCEAKMPVYASDGKKVTERADWKTRRPYIEMAAEHAGYHESKASGNQGTQIVIAVNHIGQSPNARNQRIIEASAQTD
jgi:hypothetical protein